MRKIILALAALGLVAVASMDTASAYYCNTTCTTSGNQTYCNKTCF